MVGIILDRVGRNDFVYIFIFIKSLSVIVHGMVMRVRYPANASYLLEKFMECITFDFLDFIQFTENIDWQNFIQKSGLSQKVDQNSLMIYLSDQAQNLGYKSFNAIINLKTISFFVSIYLGELLIFLIIKLWIIITKNKYDADSYLLK